MLLVDARCPDLRGICMGAGDDERVRDKRSTTLRQRFGKVINDDVSTKFATVRAGTGLGSLSIWTMTDFLDRMLEAKIVRHDQEVHLYRRGLNGDVLVLKLRVDQLKTLTDVSDKYVLKMLRVYVQT